MKSLYEEDARYIIDAINLWNDVTKAINPIFKNYIDKGYSIRDISHVAQATITDFENEHVLIGQAKNARNNSKKM